MDHQFGPRTQLIHGNQSFDHGEFRSHAFPIFQTSTFKYDSVEEGEQIFAGTVNHDAYSRISNPNHRQLEDRLCILEEGEAAQVFDSGTSAIRVAMTSLVKTGDHIVTHRNLYGGTFGELAELRNFGVKITFVDARHSLNVIRAITSKTKIIFLETPSNPLLDICNFEEITEMVFRVNRNIIIIVDSTFATPCNQKPLTRGVDIVAHSLTKYLNGSGRYIGGAIVTSRHLMNRVWERYHGSGMMDPEVAARIAENVVGIEDRMKRHNTNAEGIVCYLTMNKYKSLHKVNYPGLVTHQNHTVAKKLMAGFGGMVSFELIDDDNGSKTRHFLNQLSRDEKVGKGIISQLVSLGTTDTLICCPARSTHSGIPLKKRLAQGITDNLIRLSVGTEDIEDIIYSLERGFQAIS